MTNKKLYTLEEAENLSIKNVHELYKNFINPNQTSIFSSLPFGKELFESAEGVHMFTEHGKKVLDFTGGLGVLGLGHNHPRIINARIKFQKEKKIEVHKIIFSKYMAALSSSIASLLPDNLNKSFFLNSGAEAVEAAIKICYKFYKGEKKYILYSDKSYHGKLIGSGSISGSYKANNQFPEMENCLSYKFNDSIDLENKLEECKKNGEVYSVIIEPYSASLLQSCSDNFIEKLFLLKKKYDFKIIFDEVFTGFFKSKKMFYFQNFKDIAPDVICLSKTLGGGKSSISCLVSDENLYKKAYGKLNDTFLHTTTYNGFGEESVTALEALNILSGVDFKIKVDKLSDLLTKKLAQLKTKHHDKVESIKGTGILNGIIFKSYSSSLANITEKIPLKFVKDKSFFLKKITATAVSCELYEKFNILCSINDSAYSNHMCISPALIIDHESVNYFFESLDKVLTGNLNLKSIELIFDYLKSRV
ncbi:aminotransferase class III-fold pyridoxal phosphate-dependent enzyme [Pelagibacteraceae bacterium]|nr:aminotransferase class III-fold pyridoxal phosphate-dependent enzyme [Pelagibacteraceae bacterium]